MRAIIAIVGLVMGCFCLAAPASAAATLSLSRDSGPPGTAFTISGAGFTANQIVDVYFDLQQIAYRLTSSTGAFSFASTIPATDSPGAHTVTVMPHSGAGAAAQKDYTVRTSWLLWRGDVSNRGWNETENTLTSATVGNLDLAWTSTTGAVYAAPVVSGSAFYIIDGNGNLNAYNRVTRAIQFRVAAHANYLIPPAAGAGLVVVTGPGKLIARSAATGAVVWQANLPPGVGAPVVNGGTVYVTAQGDGNAGLYAFSMTCGTGGATCMPIWRGPGGSTSGNYVPEASVAIGDGFVYASMGTTLYAFRLSCATGGASCTPSGSRANVVSAPPVYSNGYVYVISTDNLLLALRTNCIGCTPAWSGTLASASFRSVTIARNKAYVVTGQKMVVFSASCAAATCSPLWTTSAASGSGYSPIVAGDVVYVPSSNDMTAFRADCYEACPPLWQAGVGGVFGNAPYAGVAVVDGVLYVPDSGGLRIFTLDAPPGGGSAVASARPAGASVATASPKTVVRPIQMGKLKPDPTFAAEEAALEARLNRRRG